MGFYMFLLDCSGSLMGFYWISIWFAWDFNQIWYELIIHEIQVSQVSPADYVD